MIFCETEIRRKGQNNRVRENIQTFRLPNIFISIFWKQILRKFQINFHSHR